MTKDDRDEAASAARTEGPGGVPFTTQFSRRSFLKTAGVGVASLAAFNSLAPLTAAASTRRGHGYLVEGINSDPESLNPLLASTNVGVICSRLLFDSLLVEGPTGALEPALAASLPTISKDGLTYTFKLRPGLKWSDGAPLTSADVAYTLKLLYEPKYEGFNSYLRSLAVGYIASVEAPNAQTVVVTTHKVYAPFLLTFGQVCILPSHTLSSLTGAQLNTADFNTYPAPVNGVFQLTGSGWTTGEQILYAANPYYWRGPAALSNYVIKILQNATVLATAARTGDVDIAGQVEASQVSSLRSASNLVLKEIPSDETTVVGFQLRPGKPASKFFGDLSVRQALCHALNRSAMIGPAEFGLAKLTNSCEPPSSWAYNPNVEPVYNYDPAKANAMLDAAGWARSGKGTRQKDGVPLSFNLITDNQHQDHVTIAQIVQNDWQAVGAHVSVQLVTFPELITTLITQHNFDTFIIGFNVNNESPEPDESNFWLSTSAANIPGFADAQADELMNRGLQYVDEAQRRPIYEEFQDVLAAQVPALPLWFLTYTWALSKRVKGFDVNQFQQLGARTWMKDVAVA
jgi:peptide/nickel transport system substrate-binding protein